MMDEIVFTPSLSVCPSCGSRLRAYRTDRRTIKPYAGQFTAVHRLKICMEEKIVYRSGMLENYVRPYSTYPDEVTLRSSMERFIDGRSCSEISSSMGNGISRRHVRRLSTN